MGGRLRVVSGDGQVVRTFEKSGPFVVQAVDEDGVPLQGVEVTFFHGVRTPRSTAIDHSDLVRTDRNGKASGPGTTPMLPGEQYVRVRVRDKRIDVFNSEVLFRLTATDASGPKPWEDIRDRRGTQQHWWSRRALVIGLASLLVVGGATAGAVVLLTRPGPEGSDNYVAVSPDGKFIASAENDSVYLWDTASRRLTATLPDPQQATDNVSSLALSPDGTMIAVAHFNDPAYIWDTTTRRRVATIAAAAGASGLAFSPDGKTLAICGNDVLLWDIADSRVDGTLHAVRSSRAGGPTAAAFSPDGRTLAVSIGANTDQNGNYLAPGIELWDLTTRHMVAALPGGSGGGEIAYSRDGRALAASEGGGGSYSLWDVTSKPRLKATLSDPSPNVGHYSPVGTGPVAFSPDGAALATADGSPNNSAYLWDAATGHMTATLTDPNSLGVADLAYTPDGKLLITADGNGNLYLWQITSGSIVATLTKPS